MLIVNLYGLVGLTYGGLYLAWVACCWFSYCWFVMAFLLVVICVVLAGQLVLLWFVG